jgi:hypothetical protein
MFRPLFIALVIILLTTPVLANVNMDLQLGLTQFYSGYDPYAYGGVNEKGYRVDLNTTLPFENWDLALNVRGLGFPGNSNGFSYYADFVGYFYFAEGNLTPYIAPAIGFSHSRRKHAWGDDKEQYDFYRFGGIFGLKSTLGDKYLNISFGLIAETPMWKPDNHYYYGYAWDSPGDFYLENAIQAEFGWAISDHFGMTAKLSGLKNNFVLYNYTGTATVLGYMPSIQVGPNVYF